MRLCQHVCILSLGALTASGCATMGIGSYVGPGTDFAAYRTFDWGPADALPTGDPRLDNNAVFIDHFEGAVENAMAARGFERAARGATPDLLLHYHAAVTQRLVVNHPNRQFGACPIYECGPGVEEYEVGTLLIDILDARTKRLVWRGWAQDSLPGILENQDRLENKINEAVSGMMLRLPRALLRPADAG